MARGIIVARLVKQAHSLRRARYGSGPWHVTVEGHNLGGGYESITATVALYHYSTKMLEWHYKPSTGDVQITGWWIGHGSVSDQQGVNAALSALGSNKRYSRDARGGGPRVNPGYRISASVGRAASSISSITPPEY